MAWGLLLVLVQGLTRARRIKKLNGLTLSAFMNSSDLGLREKRHSGNYEEIFINVRCGSFIYCM